VSYVPLDIFRFDQKVSLKHLLQSKLFICICSINIVLIYICTYWAHTRHLVTILTGSLFMTPPPKYAMPDPGFWAAGAPLCYVVQKPGSASPAVSGLEVLPIL
jgi:hypothetical protein